MQWINALSTQVSLEAAIGEVAAQVERSLTAPPDLGIILVSASFASDYPRLLPLLRERLPLPTLIGCGGAGIVGSYPDASAEEIEAGTALSLSVANLPGATVQAFHVNAADLPDLDSSPESWHALTGVAPADPLGFVLLVDPFSARINDLIEGLDYAYPQAAKIGGLASSGTPGTPSGLLLARDGVDQLHREGTVGLALGGNAVLDAIVAQGCRPIGQPYVVAQGERNVVLELAEPVAAGRSEARPQPPLQILRDLIQTLSPADRELAQHSLFVGLARDEFKLQLGPGDFLIRNLIGVDPKVGAIAIGDRVRAGQRLQFHLRDRDTSAEDLTTLLTAYQQQQDGDSQPLGALMFACLGRGRGLYDQANFDSRRFQEYIGNIPLGGFFCNGEIGPVGGQTFLHGYTSVFGIVRSRPA
ncbi:MAG: hypothetical protein HC910_00680 [Spirulinaceae cyanobacterium SM2_1_0]|nr:hypothetical protein [Spirulinaceae cyanobacterium SM2_1_0]